MANLLDGTKGYGVGHLQLIRVHLRNGMGEHTLAVPVGEALQIEIVARASRPTRRPNLGFCLYMPGGDLAFSVSVLNLGVHLHDLAAGEECRALFGFQMTLTPGAYALTVISADNDQSPTEDSSVHHDTRERLGPIRVTPGPLSETFDGVGCIQAQVILNGVLGR